MFKAIAVLLLLSPLAAIASEFHAFEFKPVVPKDVARVQQMWQGRNLEAKGVAVVFELHFATHIVKIIQHEVAGKTHYSAIVYPKHLIAFDVPVAVVLDGLDQYSPLLDLDRQLFWNKDGPLADMVLLFPTFRGRVLLFQGKTFYAEGEFSDAYDGATDDAMALVSAAKSIQPRGNYERILAVGGSRGGTVALLMSLRDSRVHTAIATAAVVDFYREEALRRYSYQYEWQFFRGFQGDEGRMRAIASSPLHFSPTPQFKKAALLHGEKDSTVPSTNPELMAEHLQRINVDVVKHIFPGLGHSNIYSNGDYQKQYVKAVIEFKSSAHHTSPPLMLVPPAVIKPSTTKPNTSASSRHEN